MSLVKCTHCHLEFDQSVMIKEPQNPNLNFCCNGCQGVYHLLQDDGLESFYDKVGKNTLSQPLAIGQDSSNFDMESFQKRYIKKTADGFSQVNLIIEGIHCAACIWLNEKVLDKTPGVVEASINFTNNKAQIVWDDDTIKLSQIIDKIRSIGYNAYPYDRSESEQKATKNKKDYFLRMSIAIFASMNIMMIDVAKYTGFFTGMDQEVLRMVHMAEFIFSTPVLFYSGWVFFRGAYYGLKNKIINMDLLVSSGATLTYIYSLFVLFGHAGHSYFDSVAMIITFVLVGKYLEVIGKKGAMDTIDTLRSTIPLEATRIVDGAKEVIPIDKIEIGDIIEVKNGEKASVDGIVISGTSEFDESSISGESMPVTKTTNNKIYSGTINLGQVIRYKATKDYAHSTLNSIVELLEDSLTSKPKIEETTNELSKYFSITILLLASLTFTGWYLYNHNFENSLIVAISVIVIACPCALALATPIATLVGISHLAKKGLLFKEAKHIETFAKIDTVVLDKTGTITQGKLSVVNGSIEHLTQEQRNLLYTLTDSSTHPVSVAIKKFVTNSPYSFEHLELQNIEQLPGVGLQASYNGIIIFGGKSDTSSEFTSFVFKLNDQTLATFDLEDTLKDGVKQTIEYLQSLHIDVILCSGDHENVVKKIANLLNISNYKANMDPKTKAQFITDLKNKNKTVVMVGDGVNDALALSRADIAIAMGSGADVSLAISDVVILNDQIKNLTDCVAISRRTFGFIKQNLTISLIYNALTIPVAMAGYIIPLVAALSMSLSSLIVVGNSLRIKKGK
ncbi:MAG: cadmium-translocating P-type ATPase [Campylobacterales bacterium]|nr:cadmium-translocating P-type ATPase [Campylobacterales bacterium]